MSYFDKNGYNSDDDVNKIKKKYLIIIETNIKIKSNYYHVYLLIEDSEFYNYFDWSYLVDKMNIGFPYTISYFNSIYDINNSIKERKKHYNYIYKKEVKKINFKNKLYNVTDERFFDSITSKHYSKRKNLFCKQLEP